MHLVKIPPYEKENKASSGAEDSTKSAEVGIREAGHRSNLEEDEAPHERENFDKQSVILGSDWCNITCSLV